MDMKPCPFCASRDIRYSANKPDGYLFWCGNCGALGSNDVSFENAVKMWNLRRPMDDLLAACEAMRDYIVNEVFASGGETVDQVKQADAAIARARGD